MYNDPWPGQHDERYASQYYDLGGGSYAGEASDTIAQNVQSYPTSSTSLISPDQYAQQYATRPRSQGPQFNDSLQTYYNQQWNTSPANVMAPSLPMPQNSAPQYPPWPYTTNSASDYRDYGATFPSQTPGAGSSTMTGYSDPTYAPYRGQYLPSVGSALEGSSRLPPLPSLPLATEYGRQAPLLPPVPPPEPPDAPAYSPRSRRRVLTSASTSDSPRTSVDPTVPTKKCSHCETTTTPMWRRDPETQRPLCNACGLYLQQRCKPRPLDLVRDGSEQRADANTGPECSHCETRSTSVWRRNKDGLLVCNACGVYWRLRGKERPLSLRKKTYKPRTKLPPVNGDEEGTIRGWIVVE